MTILDEICACIVKTCEGGMKGIYISSIARVSTRKIVQTIIKIFKGGIYKGNTSTRRPKKLSDRDLCRILLCSRIHHQLLLQDITNDYPIEMS